MGTNKHHKVLMHCWRLHTSTDMRMQIQKSPANGVSCKWNITLGVCSGVRKGSFVARIPLSLGVLYVHVFKRRILGAKTRV